MFWGQIVVGKFEFGCKGKVTFLVNFCSLITRWVTCGLDGDLYLSHSDIKLQYSDFGLLCWMVLLGVYLSSALCQDD